MSPAPQPGSPPSAPLGTRARLTSLDYLLQPSLTAAGSTPCPSVSGCSSNARPQAPDLNEVGDCRPRRWQPSTHTGDPQGQGWTWEGDARAKEGRYRCNTRSRKEAEAGRSMAGDTTDSKEGFSTSPFMPRTDTNHPTGRSAPHTEWMVAYRTEPTCPHPTGMLGFTRTP